MSGPPNQDFPPQHPQPWVPPQQPHQGPPPPPQPFVPQQGWNGPPPPFPPQPGFPPGFPPPLPPRKSYAGLIVGLVAFGVLAAIVLVGVAIVLQPSSNPDGSGGGSAGDSGGGQSGAAALPATRQPDGSVAVAKAGVSSPVLDIYEDFQCPVCKSFESTSGATLSDLAAQGKVKLVYRPFRLFDQEPLRSNSARAANAAACAPAGNWVELHRLLFQSQPPEGSTGFSTPDLVSLGQQAGISDSAFSSCVGGGMKTSEVEQSTKSALAAGVQGTPTLRLDGTDLSTDTVFNPDSLRSAILAKQGGGSGGSSGI